jgi:hypothetical protein
MFSNLQQTLALCWIATALLSACDAALNCKDAAATRVSNNPIIDKDTIGVSLPGIEVRSVTYRLLSHLGVDVSSRFAAVPISANPLLLYLNSNSNYTR